ncbi:MAG: tetratricopeptide repeat protein [Alphaproteobacteria bacterium]
MNEIARVIRRLVRQVTPIRGDFASGLRAYERHDYQRALRIWRRLAKRGHPQAQCKLGIMYHNGDGVPQNIAKATHLYRRAAEQGDPEALFCLRLRERYMLPAPNSPATPVTDRPATKPNRIKAIEPRLDPVEASPIRPQPKVRPLRVSEATRRKRLATAQTAYNERDYTTALRIWKTLARLENAEAQNSLAILFDHGLGVAQDQTEAIKWYHRAADHGHAKAQTNLGVMYGTGDGVPSDTAQALKWTRMAADQGTAKAQYNLGLMFVNGSGVPVDYITAYKWFSLAASQDSKDARHGIKVLAARMSEADLAAADILKREWQVENARTMARRLAKY